MTNLHLGQQQGRVQALQLGDQADVEEPQAKSESVQGGFVGGIKHQKASGRNPRHHRHPHPHRLLLHTQDDPGSGCCALLEESRLTPDPAASQTAAPRPSTRPMVPAGPVRVLVASIGNPGRYLATRHSAGHILNKLLAAHLNLPSFQKSKLYSGSISSGSDVGRPELTLWQSGHMMNESGIGLLKAWKAFSATPLSSPDSILGLVVLHDELETAPGVLKVRRGPEGSARGHNGIKSVINSLRGAGVLPELGDKFIRVGVGIGRPMSRERDDVSTYVLSPVTKGERDGIEERVSDVDRLLQTEIMRISRS